MLNIMKIWLLSKAAVNLSTAGLGSTIIGKLLYQLLDSSMSTKKVVRKI